MPNLLNGVPCDGYVSRGKDAWEFSLSETTLEEVVGLDEPYELHDGSGALVASFAGYHASGAWLSGESVRLAVTRTLETSAEEAIEAVEANMGALSSRVTAADAKADEAKVAADEAKEAASQAGTDPQVMAASAMYVNAQPLSNTQLADVRDLIEDFVQGAEYEQGWIRRHEGKYYRMAQKITSTTSQTYLPGPGMESLYTLIDLAPDGIRVWHAPTDATNSFALGERCHYPDADGPVYVSGRNGNTSEPGTDEWWTLVED